jgi:hypothetical protein
MSPHWLTEHNGHLAANKRPLHNTYSLKNTIKIDIFKIQIMERPIAEYLDFEEFVGRSDAVYKSTREATTDQNLKRKVLCSGLNYQAFKKDNNSLKPLFYEALLKEEARVSASIEPLTGLFKGVHIQQTYWNSCIAAVFAQAIIYKCDHGTYLWVLLKTLYNHLDTLIQLKKTTLKPEPLLRLFNHSDEWLTVMQSEWVTVCKTLQSLETLITAFNHHPVAIDASFKKNFYQQWNTGFQTLLYWAALATDDASTKNHINLTLPLPYYFKNNMFLSRLGLYGWCLLKCRQSPWHCFKILNFIFENSYLNYKGCFKLLNDFIDLNDPCDDAENITSLCPNTYKNSLTFEALCSKLSASKGAILQQEAHMYYVIGETINDQPCLKIHDPLLKKPQIMNQSAWITFLSRGDSIFFSK